MGLSLFLSANRNILLGRTRLWNHLQPTFRPPLRPYYRTWPMWHSKICLACRSVKNRSEYLWLGGGSPREEGAPILESHYPQMVKIGGLRWAMVWRGAVFAEHSDVHCHPVKWAGHLIYCMQHSIRDSGTGWCVASPALDEYGPIFFSSLHKRAFSSLRKACWNWC